MGKRYELIIIGSGPAGLAAAIYAQRARLSTLVLEKEYISGGQVVNTYEVDNYPGLPGISGYELGMKFREHADGLGAEFVTAEVKEILDEGAVKKIVTDKKTYEADAVILAMGATHRELGVPGEKDLAGMGVSYCATCDGAFFKGRTVAVVGGGDVAVEDAIFLARGCEKVYLIHRRDELRAAKSLQEKLFACENIEIVWDSVVKEINGEDHVESIRLENGYGWRLCGGRYPSKFKYRAGSSCKR
jgi:thioredoxin reductase (NADPH)